MRKFILPVLLFLFVIGNLLFVISARATACPESDYDCQIRELQAEIDARQPAQEKNKQDLSALRTQLDSLNKKIASLQNQLKKAEKDINTREEDLAYAKEIFEQKANSYYRFLRFYDPLTPFLSSSNATTVFKEISFRQKTIDENQKVMQGYVDDLTKLKKDQDALQKNKANLASLQKQVTEKEKFLASEVAKVDTYLSTLSARQQELAALKAGGFSTSIGDTPLTLEPCSGAPGSSNFCDPGFKPAFAAFSFGAPHRTGMSQYGAYGRSRSGQSAEDILSAYFQGASLNKSYSANSTIGVTGYGRVSLEDNYMLGIYEIPESWGDSGGIEALKAQAVAARSYALAVTNNGAGTICTTEACQVYKPQLKTGKWAEAVRATRGWVLIKDGAPAKAYFASTSGGFTISQWGWSGIVDTVGGGVGNWPGQAYEKIAGSPWFYKGWYKSRGGATCGQSNPWLTSEDLADILNAQQVLSNGSGDASRISPTDTSCWKGNPYSKSELQNLGGYTSVSSASVIYSNGGSTQQVTFSTNKGSVSLSGDDFKKAFNLRAPGYIGIKSSLFNLEVLH